MIENPLIVIIFLKKLIITSASWNVRKLYWECIKTEL